MSSLCVSAQTLFVLNHYASARDNDVFAEAERFLPERWLRGSAATVDVEPSGFRAASSSSSMSASSSAAAADAGADAFGVDIKHHHAFGCLPFGYGNRSCLGMIDVIEIYIALMYTDYQLMLASIAIIQRC